MKKIIFLAVILSLISLPSESAFLGLKKTAKNTKVRREESELSNSSSTQTSSSKTSSANLSNEADTEIIKYDGTTQKWINSNVLQNINK